MNISAIRELKEIFDLTGYAVSQAIQFLKKQTLRTIKLCYYSVIRDSTIENCYFRLFLLAYIAGHYRITKKVQDKILVDRVMVPYWNCNLDLLNLNRVFNCSKIRRAMPIACKDRRKV